MSKKKKKKAGKKKKDFYEKWLEQELKRDYRYYGLSNPIGLECDGIIALCSDFHFGSRYCAEDRIVDYLEQARDRGVKKVVVGGDYVDGMGVYRGQYGDLKLTRLDEQIALFEESLPKGLEYYVIDGNHETKTSQNLGLKVGDLLKRPGVHYCGEVFRRFVLDPDEHAIVMDVVHPRGGSYYTVGYAAQKYLRQTEPRFYPEVLNMGHFHKHLFASIYGVEVVMNGGFEYPNEFIIRQQVGSDISGWIIEFERKRDGLAGMEVLRLKPEIVKYTW